MRRAHRTSPAGPRGRAASPGRRTVLHVGVRAPRWSAPRAAQTSSLDLPIGGARAGVACEADAMESWELSAREHIRDLIAHYNLAGDRGWIDDMIALFAADATLSIDGVDHVGHDAIRAVFTSAAGPHPELIRHHVATLKIDVPSPEQASARCYFQVLT